MTFATTIAQKNPLARGLSGALHRIDKSFSTHSVGIYSAAIPFHAVFEYSAIKKGTDIKHPFIFVCHFPDTKIQVAFAHG